MTKQTQQLIVLYLIGCLMLAGAGYAGHLIGESKGCESYDLRLAAALVQVETMEAERNRFQDFKVTSTFRPEGSDMQTICFTGPDSVEIEVGR